MSQEVRPDPDKKFMPPLLRWLAALLTVSAFGLSLWLTVQKLTGKIDTLAGCGAGSGCANVLGSKWSMVLGVIPVSVFSCLLYLGVVVSLWLRGPLVSWFRTLAAWMLIGAAVWFTLVQFLIIKAICQYCMTMHGLGVALGIVLLLGGCRLVSSAKQLLTPLPLALLLVGGLAVIQHCGPEPESHRVDQQKVIDSTESADASVHAQGQGRLVSLGGKAYRVAELPHQGDKDAQHILVKYYDYTCDGCARAHGYLETLMAKFPGQFAVIVLPTPLERACNPSLPRGLKDHRNACKFARLSLRVWRADPAAFSEFHRWLFEYHQQDYEVAEGMAYGLVDADKLDQVDASWVEAVLEQNVADYRELIKETPVMPKLLIGDSQVVQGVAKDYETFERLLLGKTSGGQKK